MNLAMFKKQTNKQNKNENKNKLRINPQTKISADHLREGYVLVKT